MNRLFNCLYWMLRDAPYIRNPELDAFERKNQREKISAEKCLVFDTSICSNNLGDQIIMYYCNKIYDDLGFQKREYIPTHIHPDSSYDAVLKSDEIRFVSGTNLLSYDIQKINGWKFPKKISYLINLCLLGVGWINYEDKVSAYTRRFYRAILKNSFIHSVRDSFTERQLNKMGIDNVLNTGCPTMWGLSEEHCKRIPVSKGSKAITALTDYRQDPKYDRFMLEVILRNYEKVYFWPQGKGDCAYLEQLLSDKHRVSILERSLDSYNEILHEQEVDYIGTRLHAGIHAINREHRSIIIGVDNRAAEISKDTNLCVISRYAMRDCLESIINGKFKTDIHINKKNIIKWKEQFITNHK
ncbi:polysaccharide pyruvyl transferase family protein [Clostridiaceae bacterium]|nr:polysaccharide pyruvyl transferase family protein [Clostridiaceae bacterium]